jgi:hypothetical protein
VNVPVKRPAGFFNAVGIGLIGFAVLRPLTGDLGKARWFALCWAGAGPALRCISPHILSCLKRDEPT